MSDTTTTVSLEEMQVPKVYTRGDPHLKWAAKTGTDYGDLEALDITVPCTLNARVDVWKVPVSEHDPEGYWVSINNCGPEWGSEPGCCSWEKHLICRVQFVGSTLMGNTYEEDERNSGLAQNYFETIDTTLGLDIDRELLNPERQELMNFAMRTTITGSAGSAWAMDGKFGGDKLQGTTTIKITPVDCTLTGLASHPATVASGETYQFTADTAEAATAEIKAASIVIGEKTGTFIVEMTPGLKKEFKVYVEDGTAEEAN